MKIWISGVEFEDINVRGVKIGVRSGVAPEWGPEGPERPTGWGRTFTQKRYVTDANGNLVEEGKEARHPYDLDLTATEIKDEVPRG